MRCRHTYLKLNHLACMVSVPLLATPTPLLLVLLLLTLSPPHALSPSPCHGLTGSSIKDPLALNVDSPAQFLDGTPVEGVGQQGHAPAAQAAGKKAGPLRVSNVDALKHKARKLEPQTTTGFGLPPGEGLPTKTTPGYGLSCMRRARMLRGSFVRASCGMHVPGMHKRTSSCSASPPAAVQLRWCISSADTNTRHTHTLPPPHTHTQAAPSRTPPTAFVTPCTSLSRLLA